MPSRRPRHSRLPRRPSSLPPRPTLLAATLWSLLGLGSPVRAELPVPCAPACTVGGQTFNWRAAGSTSEYIVNGPHAVVRQALQNETFNWAQFNIGAGNSVEFQQPSSRAVALNRIFQADPSRIQGALRANGQVYLINQNGIVFGPGAKVDVNTLLASSIDLNPNIANLFEQIGLLNAVQQRQLPSLKNTTGQAPGKVEVQAGAKITAQENGRVILVGGEVRNAGELETSGPGGQVILAAAQDEVFLFFPDDPDLRGLGVELGEGGTVENLGNILARQGAITLAGLTVNQRGVVRATTAVDVNGSIRLQARDRTTQIVQIDGRQVPRPSRAGTVTLGAGSVTEVVLDAADDGTAVDDQETRSSLVAVDGRDVTVEAAATIRATSGRIRIDADDDPASDSPTAGTLRIAAGATLDASGVGKVVLPMSRNVATVEVRGNELAASPVQRGGVLFGKRVSFDVRKPLPKIANLQAGLDNLQRSGAERATVGGSIVLNAFEAVTVEAGARLDVSGGSVEYQAGFLDTTRLIYQGRLVDIADADPLLRYDGVLDVLEYTHAKWGAQTTQRFNAFGPGMRGSLRSFEPGYVEGKDAGNIDIAALHVNIAGELVADTTAGIHQALVPGDTGGFMRPWQELPRGGRLRLSAIGDDLTIGADGLPFTTRGVQSFNFDVANFELEQGAELDLGPGGALEVDAAGTVDVAGTLRAQSGSVALRAGVGFNDGRGILSLAPTARIDVSGGWVRDERTTTAAASPLDPRWIDGGEIELDSHGDLLLARGSVLDVTAGAHADIDGRIAPGAGGDLSLVARVDRQVAPRSPEVRLDATLRAFTFQDAAVSRFSASVPEIRLGGAADGERGTWQVPLDLFSAAGFGAVTLASNERGLAVADGTRIDLAARNLVRVGDGRDALAQGTLPATGTPLASFTETTLLPLYWQQATSVSLASETFFADQSLAAGNDDLLRIGSGASIAVSPGGTISLTSDTPIVIAGELRAPGGRIAAELALNTDFGYDARRAVWLAPGARLDASAVAVEAPADDAGRITALERHEGGTVHLEAAEGYVMGLAGSTIDVSGTRANLDVVVSSGLAGSRYQRLPIALDAGHIEIASSNGFSLASQFAAQADASLGAAGGTLALTLDGELRRSNLTIFNAGGTAFPEQPLRLQLGSGATLFGGAAPAAIADAQVGIGRFDQQAFTSGGFASLELAARPSQVQRGPNIGSDPLMEARIEFVGTLDLSVPGRLVLDAPIVQSDGGTARLAADYLALGFQFDAFVSSDTPLPGTDEPSVKWFSPTPGTGALHASADFIDLVGFTALRGFGGAPVVLDSAGDVRLRGVRAPAAQSRRLDGALTVASDLVIDAQRVYAATLSDFRIFNEAADGLVRFSGGGDERVPLAAGGSLTVQADRIEQLGTLMAPLGDILLDAETSLLLGPNSLTSVTLAGQSVLFGETQIGEWVFAFPGVERPTRVFDAAPVAEVGELLPQKRIRLVADGTQGAQAVGEITLARGARLDTRSGGSLLATEFLPGPQGQVDLLAADVANGSFALLPTSRDGIAAFDPLYSAGFEYGVGTTFTVVNGSRSGLAAGTYAVLPPRYALLPGAVLVTPEAGGQGAVANTALPLATADGRPIVTGVLQLDSRGQPALVEGRYVVDDRAALDLRAEYRVTDADAFFTAQAAAKGVATPLLPRDAGALSLNANAALSLGASIVRDTGSGRGARVDIGAERIAIVQRATGAGNGVELVAADLAALGADSLLIGGARDVDGSTTTITRVDARELRVDDGTTLTVPELMLVASDTLAIGERATLRGQGGRRGETRATLALAGDNALFVATGDRLPVVARSAIGASPDAALSVADSASLFGAGGLVLDSTGSADVGGTLAVGAGGGLRLGAERIGLGLVPVGFNGLALDVNRLQGLGVATLELASGDALALFDSFSLALDAMLIDAPGIEGRTDGAQVDLRAARIRLQNSQGGASAAVTTNGATLSLAGSTGASAGLVLELGAAVGEDAGADGGDFDVTGFDQVAITAERVLGVGTHVLDVDAAALTLSSGVIGSLSGAALTIATSGQLDSLALPGFDPTTLGADLLGGRVALRGATLNHAGLVYAPGGSIELESTAGALTLSGTLLAAGLSELDFGLTTLGTPGGRIALGANGGPLTIGAGAVVDVSGGRGVRAGSGGDLRLSANGGVLDIAAGAQLRGSADPSVAGARLFVDATSLAGGLSGLAAELAAGDFAGQRAVRVRGVGESLALGAGASFAARFIQLSADQGDVIVDGRLDASGAYAGRIDLSAGGTLRLGAGAELLATATSGFRAPSGEGYDDGRAGGTVTLFAPGGTLDLAGGTIDVHGTRVNGDGTLTSEASGRIQLMAARTSNSSIASGPIATNLVGARSIEVFGHQRYTTAQTGSILADSTSFGANAATVLTSLGLNTNPAARAAAGVEIVATGDLTFATLGLNLTNLFNAATVRPGLLAVRATGTLTLGNDIIDGTVNDRFSRRIADTADSWQYVFAGGADTAAVDFAAVAAGAGDLVVTANTDIVTGTGDITLAAGRDIVFGTNATVQAVGRHLDANFRGTISDAFTGPNDNFQQTAVRRFLPGVSFPEAAGDLRISAGGNVSATRPTQQISQWVTRIGGSDIGGDVQQAPDAWGVVLGSYAGNLGMFGGGDVSVDAGGDVVGVQVSNVSVGRQQGVNSYNRASRVWTVTSNVVDELGGGRVDVRAGGDVAGIDVHVSRGDALVKAGQGIVGRDVLGVTQLARLFIGDADVSLEAARDLEVGTVIDPNTLLLAVAPAANPQPQGTRFETFYFTMTANSALNLSSTAGNILFANDAAGTSNVGIAADPLINLYPGELGAYAASGRIGIGQRMNLFPSATGTLRLVAADDIGLASAGAAVGQLLQMDSDPALLPTLGNGFAHPIASGAQNAASAALIERLVLERDAQGRLIVDHAAQPVHTGDRTPNLMLSRDADIANLELALAKRSLFGAGRDITQIVATVQNVHLDDLSLFQAGRDFVMTAPRVPGIGRVTTTSGIGVDVAGPGGAQFIAGRDINLGTSVGIRSIGDFANPALADSGADLTLIAGAGREPAWDVFADSYFDRHASSLVLYDANGTRLPATRAGFAAQTLARRRELALQMLFGELRDAGVAASDPASPRFDDYSAGFDAIATLFPGSYAGNIETALSTVQTQDGGSINLAVPGGFVDAGLTSTAGLAGAGEFKEAIELGYIVFRTGSINAFVRDDFNVNSTRVFAQQGGDILIWSSAGDIDAGRGAKSAASIPLVEPVFDERGNFVSEPPLAVAGSGIRNFAPPGVVPGTLYLFAPQGVIDAGDAGIGSAGNVVLGATDVIGADNIDVGGLAVGVPTTDTGSIAAGLSGVGDVAASATKATEKATAAAAAAEAAAAADAGNEGQMSIISVKVLGFGA